MASPNAPAVERALVQAGVWELGQYTFASGASANNKLFMERVFGSSEACELLFDALGKLVLAHGPVGLWGVPTGGQEYAEELGRRFALPVIRLRKLQDEPGNMEFAYESLSEEAKAAELPNLVGIEDATTTLSSLVEVLRVPGLRAHTMAIAAGWRRGDPAREHRLPGDLSIQWVVERQVPNHIDDTHPFYQRYGAMAVRQVA